MLGDVGEDSLIMSTNVSVLNKYSETTLILTTLYIMDFTFMVPDIKEHWSRLMVPPRKGAGEGWGLFSITKGCVCGFRPRRAAVW